MLFLLPEIALTKQIIQRLEKIRKTTRFYHQKLTDFEKVEVWRKVKIMRLKSSSEPEVRCFFRFKFRL